MHTLAIVAIVASVFIVPALLASVIARAARMPDQAWRVYLFLFSILASLVITITGWPPKLGIDLSGGSRLVYEAQDPKAEIDMDKLLGAVKLRVDSGGVKEVVVRPYGLRQIEIIIPKATDEELRDIKEKVSTTGLLQFRILADPFKDAEIIKLANALDPAVNEVVTTGADGKRHVEAVWVPMKPEFAQEGAGGAILRTNSRGQPQVLILIDDWNVDGGFLTNASTGIDDKGQNAVFFAFNSAGARRFGNLTGENLPDKVQGRERRLGILLDGEMQSAPGIISKITDRGQISGSFTKKETELLAEILNAGSLPTSLQKEPSTELRIGATLGADTIAKGRNAMLVSTMAVVIFMVIYYRFAGVVANIALLLNVLLIVASMIAIHAAFTMAGLAGLALTVGMAVDANVLIYERMREEIARGATLRMAIRNGFGRATTTIVDANVTTLISAVVLFAIGTEQVKGFAVTLILGILMNLFTAIFCSRLMFDIAEKLGWIRKLSMMQMLSIHGVDFIGKRYPAIAASLIVIGIGFVGVVARGKGLLDIDFTGGVSVETLFEGPQDIAEVRTSLEELKDENGDAALPDLTVQNVQISNEAENTRFVVNTSLPDTDQVEKLIEEAFKGKLQVNQMTVDELAALPGTAPAAAAGAAPAGRSLGGGVPGDAKDDAAILFASANVGQDAAADAGKAGETAKEEPKQEEAKKSDEPKVGDAKAAPTDPAKEPAKSTPEAEKSSAAAIKPASERFPGGTEATLRFTSPIAHDALAEVIRTALAEKQADAQSPFELSADGYDPATSSSTGFTTWRIQMAAPPDAAKAILGHVANDLADQPFFPSSSTIGASVAGDTQRQALMAMVASLVLILIYLWFRFSQVMFGVAAVVAVIHDVLVTLGALALSYYLAPYLGVLMVEPFKISMPVIAAFLTLIGYSLNDTIVIFDRIRELRGKSKHISVELANLAINQTMSRTILTSLTVFIVVLILYVFGGQGIHPFAFALVVGVLAGTYSTIFIATPIVLWMNASAESPTNEPSRDLQRVA